MRRFAASAALALLPAAMFAHEGHDHGGLAAGLAHPWTGADHLLAMVTVGLLAARIGGHGRWLVPLGFVLPMALGGLLGLAGMSLPGVEWGVAASLLVFGALVASKRTPSPWIAAAVVAPFALCHGFAHGAELPAGAGGAGYVAGFLAATCALHAIGLGAGQLAATVRQPGIVRVAGAAVAAASLLLLASLI
jgi:urease accessory protein